MGKNFDMSEFSYRATQPNFYGRTISNVLTSQLVVILGNYIMSG